MIHSGQEALQAARRLVARGWDYDSIVALLKREPGLHERQARAVTARAFKPAPKTGAVARRRARRDQPAARPEPPGLSATGSSVSGGRLAGRAGIRSRSQRYRVSVLVSACTSMRGNRERVLRGVV